jgi:hypothetical protein
MAPVGRTRVWDSMRAYVTRGTSAVLLLSGTPGSGRTHLMRRLGNEAREAGFKVAGCEEPLPIDATTRMGDVSRALVAVLGETTRPPRVGGLVAGVLRPVTDRMREERSLFSAIEAASPVFIGVDGYAPGPVVQAWVETRLLPHIRRQADPVLMVLVDRPDRVAPLAELADGAFELGDLDEDEVREHLRDVSDGLVPALSEDELASYTAAAVKDPSCLRALDRVLGVLAPER